MPSRRVERADTAPVAHGEAFPLSLFVAAVDVRLKPAVLDPQGQAVAAALRGLGFTSVEDVRVGKHVEVRLSAADADTARDAVERMCKELLANPVLEAFSYTVVPAGAAEGAVPADRLPPGGPAR